MRTLTDILTRLKAYRILPALFSAALVAACDPTAPVEPPDAGPVCLAPDPLPGSPIRFQLDSSGAQWFGSVQQESRKLKVIRVFTPDPGGGHAYQVSDSGTETTSPNGDTTTTTVPYAAAFPDSARDYPITGFADLIKFAENGIATPLLRLHGCLEKHTETMTIAGPTSGAWTDYAYKAEGDSLVFTSIYTVGPVAGIGKRIVIGLKDGLRSWSWNSGGRYGRGTFDLRRLPEPARKEPVCFDALSGPSGMIRYRVTTAAAFLQKQTLDTIDRAYSLLPDSQEVRRFAVTETGTRTIRETSKPDSTGSISQANTEANPVLRYRDFGSLAAALDPYAPAIPLDFEGCLPDSAGKITQIPGTHSTTLEYAVAGDSLVFRLEFFDVRNQWKTTRVFERKKGLRRLESIASSIFGTNRKGWKRVP